VFIYNMYFHNLYLFRSSPNVFVDIFTYILSAYSDKWQNSAYLKFLPAENNVKNDDKDPNAKWIWNA
jgi:hypothetical protein